MAHEYALDSEQLAELQEAAATLIQKVWRGFSTRRVLEGIFDLDRSLQLQEEEEIIEEQHENKTAQEDVGIQDYDDFSGEESVRDRVRQTKSPNVVYDSLEG